MDVNSFIGGIFAATCGWPAIIYIVYKFDSRADLKFKDFNTLLPDPNSAKWKYKGEFMCRHGAPFDRYPLYQLDNIKVYAGVGACINDSFIAGSAKYAQDVLNGQTQIKMIEKVLEE